MHVLHAAADFVLLAVNYFGGTMFDRQRRMLLVLITIVLLALVPGLFIRGTILQDLRSCIEGERADLARLAAMDMESAYAKNRAWSREGTAEAAVRALMLGMRVQVKDSGSAGVMDTETALALVPASVKARALEIASTEREDANAERLSQPLFMGKERIGSLEITFPVEGKSALSLKRSGWLLLAWSLGWSAAALVLGILFLRRSAATKSMSSATVRTRNAPKQDPVSAVAVQEQASVLPKTQGSAHEENAVLSKQEEQDALPEEPLEEDDEDMQHLPGDADRITRIVDRLDELTRAQTLVHSLQKQPIVLAPFLGKVIDQARNVVKDRNVVFNLECGNELTLSADPACLTGIMSNLFENAAKAVKKEGKVVVQVVAEGDGIKIVVSDTGSGIRRKALPHIYEQYYRGSGNGIGLGLTIVKELVAACGGTIDVETALGKGTTFTVSIPIA